MNTNYTWRFKARVITTERVGIAIARQKRCRPQQGEKYRVKETILRVATGM